MALARGEKVAEVCRKLGVTEQTHYRWRCRNYRPRWAHSMSSGVWIQGVGDDEGSARHSAEWRTVTCASDGDTIVVDGGERVRLIVHAGGSPLGASPMAPPHELLIAQDASGTAPLREYNLGAPAR